MPETSRCRSACHYAVEAMATVPRGPPELHPVILQHVSHRKPAALADQPLRGHQRAAREDGAIADGVRQLDRFRRTVEADRVRARDRSGARRRDVDRPRVARRLPCPFFSVRRCPTARPSSSRGAPRESTRRTPACAAKRRAASSTTSWNTFMPSEKFDAASTPMPACAATSRIAASCACHPVVPITTLMLALGQLRQVLRHRVGQREIDRHVDRAEGAVGNGAVARVLVDDAGDGGAVGRAPATPPAAPCGRGRAAARASQAITCAKRTCRARGRAPRAGLIHESRT